MTDLILGLDSSCYTTSLAAVTISGDVFGSYRKLLPVENGERGLRQSDAVFIHIRQYPELFEKYHCEANHCRVVAVCASDRPRDTDDSYMPVFKVGETVARGMAASLNVPFFTASHQQGHIAAVLPGSGILPDQPFLALHLSGGTTEMLLVDKHKMLLIGGSRDLHAGQLVDRTGVMMGTGFPAGPSLEIIARNGKCESLLPVSMDHDPCWCHLSGAENGIRKLMDQGFSRPQIAREVYDFLSRTILRMIQAGEKKTGVKQVILAGGVSSSELFREIISDRAKKIGNMPRIAFGEPSFSGDNAVGTALIGLEKWMKGIQKS